MNANEFSRLFFSTTKFCSPVGLALNGVRCASATCDCFPPNTREQWLKWVQGAWRQQCRFYNWEVIHILQKGTGWITHPQWGARENLSFPVKQTVVHTFISATLLFVTAGEGLLFSPSVAHLEVSIRSRRGMQRARRIVLYSLRKFWFSSPYMMALRQLLKYAMK